MVVEGLMQSCRQMCKGGSDCSDGNGACRCDSGSEEVIVVLVFGKVIFVGDHNNAGGGDSDDGGSRGSRSGGRWQRC